MLACLRFGNVVLMIQPPRGFGENPIAIYHDPDLPPSHHYLAAYRWLRRRSFGADAVVHLGKHGTLEWLPGKGLGLSAECAPDAVLGDLPLVYPFIVNDPGEGTQAKRRAHAVVVDHLVPPMARADTYGELAKLEQLLDEYATVAALDPAKLPALRAQIWELVEAAQLHHDLRVDAQPGSDEFDDFVLHVDGYLCEVKDAQIRDGLHILGDAPVGEALVNLVLAVLRAAPVWVDAPRCPGCAPALAAAYGLDEQALLRRQPGAATPRRASQRSRPRPTGRKPTAAEHSPASSSKPWPRRLGRRRAPGIRHAARRRRRGLGRRPPRPRSPACCEFACAELVPRLRAPPTRSTRVLHALDGGYVPAGPSGSPTRGLVNVLPTGRNFYSVDPKAIPSRNAWDVGPGPRRLAARPASGRRRGVSALRRA